MPDPTPLRPMRSAPCGCCGRFMVVAVESPAGRLFACLNCDSWAGCGAHNQGRLPGMEPISEEQTGAALHGDKVTAETHPQPETTVVPSDTLVQTGPPAGEDDEADDDN